MSGNVSTYFRVSYRTRFAIYAAWYPNQTSFALTYPRFLIRGKQTNFNYEFERTFNEYISAKNYPAKLLSSNKSVFFPFIAKFLLYQHPIRCVDAVFLQALFSTPPLQNLCCCRSQRSAKSFDWVLSLLCAEKIFHFPAFCKKSAEGLGNSVWKQKVVGVSERKKKHLLWICKPNIVP